MFAAMPHALRAEINEFEKTKLFSARSYKVLTSISTSDETSTMVVEIFDTGAGPNLVQEDVLPTPWLENVQPIRA